VHDDEQQQPGADPRPDELLRTPQEAAAAADRMRTRAAGPLYVVEQTGGDAPAGWLVLTPEALDGHPRRTQLKPVGRVEPPHDGPAVIEVTFTPPGTRDVLSLGTMDPAAAMALLDLLQDANGLILRRDDAAGSRTDEVPPPTGYMVLLDSARPGTLAVRTSYAPRRFAGDHDAREDLGVPGGDPHSGPASLVVVLDHWAEEHGYRFVHTRARLNQPIEQFLAELAPDDRHRVVIVSEDDDDGVVRIGEALDGTTEVLELAALSTDWLASLPPAG
jgi:hypothetical protein